ncbi:MAG: endolytic transglycosylase MltG [Tissierellia bacterium]|nr:endolytic transglycosylase MltG [Tissierellia bacterium]
MEKTKAKGISSIIVIVLALIIIAAVYFALGYYRKALGPVALGDNKEIRVEVPAGSSTEKIASILYENGLIHNRWIFKLKVKEMGVGSSLKAGEYSFNRSMDLEEIVGLLTKGTKSYDTTRFTIPEGYELDQIGQRLADEGLVDFDRFMELASDKANFEGEFSFLRELEEGQSLEGFLFPSTYEVYLSASEEDIIRKMLAEFEKIYEAEIKDKLAEFDFTLNEAVTLASIIEREGKLDEERPLMSAVFHNRLRKGMKLESCATVQYILGERKENLTTAETQIPSPYNTYVNMGLPPGPIASAGKASLVAAVNPADVDYLFFVLTGSDGSHTFTRTYEEHLRAKPKN